MDGFIVPTGTDTSTNVYKITQPTLWSNADGNDAFDALIIFESGASFDVDTIMMTCDSSDIEDREYFCSAIHTAG